MTVRQIEIAGSKHPIYAHGLNYGVCNTAADVAAKVVTVPDGNFKLEEGAALF